MKDMEDERQARQVPLILVAGSKPIAFSRAPEMAEAIVLMVLLRDAMRPVRPVRMRCAAELNFRRTSRRVHHAAGQ